MPLQAPVMMAVFVAMLNNLLVSQYCVGTFESDCPMLSRKLGRRGKKSIELHV